jgi:hypothetical protein
LGIRMGGSSVELHHQVVVVVSDVVVPKNPGRDAAGLTVTLG